MRFAAVALVGLIACVPPEKSLEGDVRELLDERDLDNAIVFCQTGDGSRTAMCAIERSGSGARAFVDAFGLRPLDAERAEDAALLELWSEPVRCQRIGMFGPGATAGAYRSAEDAGTYDLPHTSFRHIVVFDSAIKDQVCLQIRYAEGMEPGWR